MKKFNILKGIPANLPMMNVDTDMIIPKQFLKTIKRTGLGKGLFFEMRYDEKNKKIEKFVLNKEPYNHSSILFLVFYNYSYPFPNEDRNRFYQFFRSLFQPPLSSFDVKKVNHFGSLYLCQFLADWLL